MKNNTKIKSVQEKQIRNYTIGIDLADKQHEVFIIDGKGEIIISGKIQNTKNGFKKLSEDYPKSKCIIEIGTHSPWISRYLKALGMDVIVANARKLCMIIMFGEEVEQEPFIHL